MSKAIHALMGAVFGAMAGYAWHRFVGCKTGSCPIAANPYISAIYGAAIGAVLALS